MHTHTSTLSCRHFYLHMYTHTHVCMYVSVGLSVDIPTLNPKRNVMVTVICAGAWWRPYGIFFTQCLKMGVLLENQLVNNWINKQSTFSSFNQNSVTWLYLEIDKVETECEIIRIQPQILNNLVPETQESLLANLCNRLILKAEESGTV